MFDKIKFAQAIKEIYSTYDNQRIFAEESDINRTYLSQYMNMKLETPPKPKILEKIANASKGIVTYDQLMQICGYTNYMIDNFFDNAVHQRNNQLPIIYGIDYDEEKDTFIVDSDSRYIIANFVIEKNKEYFAYKIRDNSMLPILGSGDIAIIQKTTNYSSNYTYLIFLDNEETLIRKIKDKNDHIELHTFMNNDEIKIVRKSDFEKRNFRILGKVIKAENESAFK